MSGLRASGRPGLASAPHSWTVGTWSARWVGWSGVVLSSDGLWVAEGVDDELGPAESQWLVVPLLPGLPLADGGDVDELCWFRHWATAKPGTLSTDANTERWTVGSLLPRRLWS